MDHPVTERAMIRLLIFLENGRCTAGFEIYNQIIARLVTLLIFLYNLHNFFF